MPEPLAGQVLLSARSQAKSASEFVLGAIASKLAGTPVANDQSDDDPLLGLLSDEPELADFIERSAMQSREARPLRAGGE
ncbi:hypothetical protein [Pirellulimonas nuda]|nr:hypothetical protein [Pirellulimonas nuda]